MNTYGTRFRVTTYGESHGPAVGAVIDGCPAGVNLDMDAIAHELARRREGAPRQEADAIEWLSGLRDGITLGTSIAFAIHNRNARPEDYDRLTGILGRDYMITALENRRQFSIDYRMIVALDPDSELSAFCHFNLLHILGGSILSTDPWCSCFHFLNGNKSRSSLNKISARF